MGVCPTCISFPLLNCWYFLGSYYNKNNSIKKPELQYGLLATNIMTIYVQAFVTKFWSINSSLIETLQMHDFSVTSIISNHMKVCDWKWTNIKKLQYIQNYQISYWSFSSMILKMQKDMSRDILIIL